MLSFCLCSFIFMFSFHFPIDALCRDEFSGVEGMVKIKNLDDGDFASNTNLNANVSNVIELKLHGNDHSTSSNNHEMKRCCEFF